MSFNVMQHEELVYNTLLEYLNKNRSMNLTEVVPFLSSRLSKASVNINNEGIVKILKNLIKKRLVVEGSMLVKEEILDIPKRKKIYDYIMDNPGVYFNTIKKKLKLSSHLVLWHLNMLTEFGYINKVNVHNHELYFDVKLNPYEVKVNYFFSHEKSGKMLEYLSLNTYGISKTKLSTELGFHINTITKYLDSLEVLRIIYREKHHKQVLYFINEDFLQEILN